jgi:hypothetical protein
VRSASSLTLFSRARVGGFVRAGQVLEIKVCVDLGRGDIRMSQELLDAAKFSTGFKQMRGERVPEQVGVHVLAQPLAARPESDSGLNAPRPQTSTRLAYE